MGIPRVNRQALSPSAAAPQAPARLRSTHRATPYGKISRRDWLKLASLGVAGVPLAGWFEALAARSAADPSRRRSCILLWMSGGPSQIDTFDPKPGHVNGGPFREIATSVPGLRIAEHLPKLARQAQHLAIIRSLSSTEGDHARATRSVHTAYSPRPSIDRPTFGSLVASELASTGGELPGFVSISPDRAAGPAPHEPGFLGAQFAPLLVDSRQAADGSAAGDFEFAATLSAADFFAEHADAPLADKPRATRRAAGLLGSQAGRVFNLAEEPAPLRDAYGRNRFGQGCLLARRLIERGVPFVEVGLSGNGLGWDSHANNFETVRNLSAVLDPAWATLIEDLRLRGLLETTLIVWIGEFGRTPKINQAAGRDHFPNAWSAVLAGGGIAGGQAYGRTTPDGMSVADNPVTPADLLATVCGVLGIDWQKPSVSNLGRAAGIVDPASIVDSAGIVGPVGIPIQGVLA